MQLGEHNVRVNSISPSAIPAGIFGKAFGLEADRADTAAGLLWQRSQKRNPFRAGSPDDIAEAAIFLASDHSSFSGLSAGRSVRASMPCARLWEQAQMSVGQLSFECHFAMTQLGA